MLWKKHGAGVGDPTRGFSTFPGHLRQSPGLQRRPAPRTPPRCTPPPPRSSPPPARRQTRGQTSAGSRRGRPARPVPTVPAGAEAGRRPPRRRGRGRSRASGRGGRGLRGPGLRAPAGPTPASPHLPTTARRPAPRRGAPLTLGCWWLSFSTAAREATNTAGWQCRVRSSSSRGPSRQRESRS